MRVCVAGERSHVVDYLKLRMQLQLLLYGAICIALLGVIGFCYHKLVVEPSLVVRSVKEALLSPTPRTIAFAESVATAPALLLFDGDCAVCNASVTFLCDRDPECRILFAPLQSAEGQQLVTRKSLPRYATPSAL